MVSLSPYERFPRIPRWRRELKITLPALALIAFALLAVKVIFSM
jgi:ABC-type sugar transport system permease subunit